MPDIQTLLEKLYLWQLTFLLSLSLLSIYFTGDTLIGGEALQGREDAALYLGVALLIASILLRYVPPPTRRQGLDGDRPKVAISPTQTALCSQIVDWKDFNEASKIKTTDYELNKDDLQLKNTEIRLELATLQGLLMRKVDESGRHLVKYRYADDATTFVPGE